MREKRFNKCRYELLDAEGLEKRVDCCEIANFEKIIQEYPKMKNNSLLKSFLASQINLNKIRNSSSPP